LPGRHVKPRHKAPGSLARSAAAMRSGIAAATPRATTAAAVVGVAGAAVVVGALAVDRPDGGQHVASATSTHRKPPTATFGGRGLQQVSRSFVRPPLASEQRKLKTAALSTTSQSLAHADTVTVAATNPRDIARQKLAEFGWDASQFTCLDQIWTRESNWNYRAENAYSGAYGIPQSLPASKMASAGSDYLTNPATQIEWGLRYIKGSYGSPCGAWAYWTAHSSY
jgi:hypothetical protein